MNPPEPTPEPIDLLARAEAALKGEPAPAGPSDALIARTRAALRDADDRAGATSKSRRGPMIVLLKLAAASALAASAGGLAYFVTTAPAGASPFEATAQKLRDARTLSFKIAIKMPDKDRPMTGREYFKDPGLVRNEMDAPDAAITVFDVAQGKILSLDPKSKAAILQNMKFPDDVNRHTLDRASSTASHLRSLAGKTEKPVGKRAIGGIEAQGFRVDEADGQTWTVWIDPKEKMPVLMESAVRINDRDIPTSMSDFQIDPPLDDSLFSLDPPDGYKVTKIDAPIAVGEKALINLLRLYAEAAGGAFPAKLDDPAIFQKQFPKEKWKGPDDPEMIRTVQSMAASVVFLQFELKKAYGYAPDKAKLGEAGKVLFWYRPKNSDKYRAIFGDLHAEDVDADRLPEKPNF
jgi:outer membrane lipoprotein-sorting protein